MGITSILLFIFVKGGSRTDQKAYIYLVTSSTWPCHYDTNRSHIFENESTNIVSFCIKNFSVLHYCKHKHVRKNNFIPWMFARVGFLMFFYKKSVSKTLIRMQFTSFWLIFLSSGKKKTIQEESGVETLSIWKIN